MKGAWRSGYLDRADDLPADPGHKFLHRHSGRNEMMTATDAIADELRAAIADYQLALREPENYDPEELDDIKRRLSRKQSELAAMQREDGTE